GTTPERGAPSFSSSLSPIGLLRREDHRSPRASRRSDVALPKILVGSIQAFIRRDSGDRRFACVARVARTPTARGSERSGFEEAIRKEIRDQKINFRPNSMMRAGQALSTLPRSWPPLEPVQGSPNPVLPRQPLFTSLYC